MSERLKGLLGILAYYGAIYGLLLIVAIYSTQSTTAIAVSCMEHGGQWTRQTFGADYCKWPDNQSRRTP